MDFKYSWKKCKAAAWEKELHWEEWPVLTNWEWQEILVKLGQSGSAVSSPAGHRANKRLLVNFQLKMKQPTTIIFVVFFSQLTVKSLHILLGYSGQNWSKDHKTQRPKFQRANILTDRCIKNFVIISGDLNIKPPLNKCIGDDTKAAARQSPHCLKNNKIWRKTILNMANGIITPYNVERPWHWLRQVTASCSVALGWHAMELAQTFAILEFYIWFRFWPYHRSRHFILHQSVKFYRNRTTLSRKNDVMSFFKMADLSHLGF